uniref:Uncharacterized protein n=1 Tax=Solanum tuberosum TaxID=4113 RepID=M1DQK4_SOLTU
MLNEKPDEDTNSKEKKDPYDFVDKEQQICINEEASKPGATIDNMDDNFGTVVSSRSKRVHESTSKPVKEGVRTSLQQNDIVQRPSQAKRKKALQYTLMELPDLKQGPPSYAHYLSPNQHVQNHKRYSTDLLLPNVHAPSLHLGQDWHSRSIIVPKGNLGRTYYSAEDFTRQR